MKFKRILKLMLIILIAFTSSFSVVEATINWGTAVYISRAGQVVDSITVNGKTVSALYAPRNSVADYDSSTTYSCAAFVKRFYSEIYGIGLNNLYPGNTPNISSGSGQFYKTSSPKVGDIAASSGHWAIVKAVNSNSVTLIEQNAWNTAYTAAMVGRTLTSENSYWFWRWSGNDISLNHNPECDLDSIEGGANNIYVRGWAFDRDNLSEALEIQVFIGGPSGTGEGHAIKANVSRKDVHQVHSCGENHGFSATIPTYKRGQQEVYIYLINIGIGENVLLAKRTVEIGRGPTGDLDAISGGKGNISVRGWAFDIDQTSQPLSVHVYIGGPAGSDTGEIHQITANKYRPDVNKVFSCGDYHGFDDIIKTNKSGTQDIYIYMKNVGQGQDILLAKRSVSIEKKSEASAKPTTAPAKNPSESSSTKTQKQKLIKKPGKVKIKKLKKSGKKRAKITWKKIKCNAWYEIEYCRKRNFSGKVYHGYASKAKNTYTIKAKSQNTYYVRVRAVNWGYISQSRVGYKYGSWSKVKKIKLK